MSAPIPADVVAGLLAAVFVLGVAFDRWVLPKQERADTAVRHVLTPASDPDDWGHDVYVVTVRYAGGRQQTLVLVDTDSAIDDGPHADGPTTWELDAYVEDVIDDATIQDLQHVQAYQVDPDIDIRA